MGYNKLYLALNLAVIVWQQSWWILYFAMALLFLATSIANDIAVKNYYKHSSFIVDDI